MKLSTLRKVIAPILLFLPSKCLLYLIDHRLLEIEITVPRSRIAGILPAHAVDTIRKRGFLCSRVDVLQMADYELHPTIKRIYKEGRHYKETEQYKKMRTAVLRYQQNNSINPTKNGAYWCRTEKDIAKYFDYLDRSFKSISKNGFLIQEDVRKQNPELVKGAGADNLKFMLDSNSNFIFIGDGGNHRFGIFQLLQLPTVTGVLFGVSGFRRSLASIPWYYFGCEPLRKALIREIYSI